MREYCYCKVKLDDGARIPERKHDDDAGYDIYANADVTINPGEVAIVPTGVHIEPAFDWYVQIVPRSGLAAKHGITVLNTPGTVDSNYRDEIKVIMINHGFTPYPIFKGDRIAQMIFTPSYRAAFVKVDELGDSDRGLGGLGSTGK